MKKMKFAVVLVGLFMSVAATAQTKIGYIRIDEIVSLLPELGNQKVSMDTVGQKYVGDSIMPRLNLEAFFKPPPGVMRSIPIP